MQIAFIGLGNMGSGMSANLVKAGHEVIAFDLSQTAMENAKAKGCLLASSAAQAVKSADAVITMLPAGKHVHGLYQADILPHAPKTALLIDCSTIDIETARIVAKLAQNEGFCVADAPVSGGIMAADAGNLAFMVGCETENFAAIKRVLEPMSRITIHAGEAGNGQAAKICNNMLLGISMIGVCEAFALAEKLGLRAENFYDIVSQSSGQCWSVTTYCPIEGVGPKSPADNDYQGGFATDMMLKDMQLAQMAAAMSGASTPLGAQAEALYAISSNLGRGQRDFSAILELLAPGTLDKG